MEQWTFEETVASDNEFATPNLRVSRLYNSKGILVWEHIFDILKLEVVKTIIRNRSEYSRYKNIREEGKIKFIFARSGNPRDQVVIFVK